MSGEIKKGEIIEVGAGGEIVPRSAAPSAQFQKYQDQANAIRQMVDDHSMWFAGKRYPLYEAWCCLASMNGVMVKTESIELGPDGCEAVVTLVDIRTGVEVGRGLGFVGVDEVLWYGGEGESWETKWENGKKTRIKVPKKFPKRTNSQIRSMAQTRAGARACKQGLCHIMAMLGKNYGTTPAEELPDDGDPEANEPIQDQGPPVHQPYTKDNIQPPKPANGPKIDLSLKDGKYPSGITQAQLEAVKGPVQDRRLGGALLAKFGDPRSTRQVYDSWLSELTSVIEAEAKAAQDAEGASS